MSTQKVDDHVMQWLLAGDGAVRFQTHRDLLADERPDLEQLVASDGDAATILDARGADGHWGRGFYQPKWTSSHYSLLEMRDLGVAPGHAACAATVALIARQKGGDGGVNPSGSRGVAGPADGRCPGCARAQASPRRAVGCVGAIPWRDPRRVPGRRRAKQVGDGASSPGAPPLRLRALEPDTALAGGA